MNRIKLILASVVIAAFFAVPAAASAAPVNLTEWSPGRLNTSSSGEWQSIAVNPTNGNQLVAFYQVDGDPKYSAGVWTSSGDTVGSLVDLTSYSGQASSSSTPVGAYNPKTGGWMVVYYDYDAAEYEAQLLSANGALSGSAQVISAAPDISCCTNPDIAWDSAKQQFFVVWSDYGYGGLTGQPQARFVNPSTGAPVGSAPIDLVTNASDFVWDDYHSIQVAYSTKQDGFGVTFRGYLSIGTGDWGTYFLRLDSDGQPIGTPQIVDPVEGVTNGSIAYSKASNRYAVAWSLPYETGSPVLVQLFNAATGDPVGSPVVQPVPATAESNRYRIHIAADEYGSGYAVVSFTGNTVTTNSEIYALWLDSSAQPVGSPDWVSGDIKEAERPQIAFDRHSGCFRTTFIGRDAATQTYYDVYSAEFGTSGLEGCSKPPSGAKPSLKKVGAAGARSLRVKVGCAGASACRIKFSGRLKGGSGKLDGKTVKVKAGKKKTVTLDYSSGLISELSGRSGSKIKVTAKQVGGKSRRITIAVPDSVTG